MEKPPCIEKIIITAEDIASRVSFLSKELGCYRDKNPIFVGILKGSFVFMADLIRNLDFPLQIDFMAVSSYGNSSQSSGVVRILKDLDTNIEQRHVLIVEDIVDTGLTLSYLVSLLKKRSPLSLKIVTLLDKRAKRVVAIEPDYVGFCVEDKFLVGYGLDYAEKYRNFPFIGVLKDEEIRKK